MQFCYQVKLDIIQSSLFDSFASRLKNKVDILLFNPPYVPTPYEEVQSAQNDKNIVGSWAGGNFGMELTNKVLDNLDVSDYT